MPKNKNSVSVMAVAFTSGDTRKHILNTTQSTYCGIHRLYTFGPRPQSPPGDAQFSFAGYYGPSEPPQENTCFECIVKWSITNN